MVEMYTNRSHPMFQGQNYLNSLNLGITTLCTMKCPNCSISVPKHALEGTAKDATLSELFGTGLVMQGLRRVHITGGEPTRHTFFRELAANIQSWFGCKYLTIETNGFGYMKHRDYFNSLFDLVFITHYQKDAIYPGSPDNTEIIEQAQKDLGVKLIREEPVRHSKGHASLPMLSLTVKEIEPIKAFGEGPVIYDKPCSKYFDPGLPAGWYHNKLYRCCVSFGLDENLGIPVTKDWKEKLANAAMGCERCLFQGT